MKYIKVGISIGLIEQSTGKDEVELVKPISTELALPAGINIGEQHVLDLLVRVKTFIRARAEGLSEQSKTEVKEK